MPCSLNYLFLPIRGLQCRIKSYIWVRYPVFNPYHMNLKFWTWGKTPTQGTSTSIWATGTKAVYPELNNGNVVQRSFNNNAAVYSIVKKDSKKFGSIPRYLENSAEEEVEAGPLWELLNRPNRFEGQDAFFTKVRAFYKVSGEAYIWLNRGDTDMLVGEDLIPLDDIAQSKKPILEMYVLPSQDVVVIPEDDNPYGISGYSLQSRPDIKFRQVDVIQWKDINLNWDPYSRTQLRGMSPLQPGRKILTANDAATDNTVAMNQNGGAKVLLANKTMAQMNPKQESDLRNVIDNKVNNIDSKGAVAAVQGDWSSHPLGMSSIDMDVLNGKAYSMQELCFLFGMPYELFDAATTYANKEMAQRGWVSNEIMPDCKQLDDELNRVLPMAFGDTAVKICSDFDALPELQVDKKAQVEWLNKAPLTANEQREALGYEEIDEPDADKILIGTQSLETIAGGDGGEEILTSLYNANGTANRGNGNGKVPQGGKGA
jgi:HK97 family phage portal protein